MEVEETPEGITKLTHVYNGVLFETEEGNQMGVCMRDDTLEINILPGGEHTQNWWRVDMKRGKIEKM